MPIDTNGYEYRYDPNNRVANGAGKVYVHREVMSDHLGRKLKSSEHVHHIDGNKLNNNTKNLIILTRSEHAKIHAKPREKRKCEICGNETYNKKHCSIACSRIASRKVRERPDKEQLLEEISKLGYCGTGRKYGVSDNAIRKWLK